MRFKARRKGVFLNQEHVEGAGLAKSQRAVWDTCTQVALGSRGAQGSWVVLMGSRNLSDVQRPWRQHSPVRIKTGCRGEGRSKCYICCFCSVISEVLPVK